MPIQPIEDLSTDPKQMDDIQQVTDAAPRRRDAGKWSRLNNENPAYRSISKAQDDALYQVQRLINKENLLEGSALPPTMSAGTRIETPTDFVIGYQEELEGGCRFVLNWSTPAAMLTYRPRYRVYAYYGQSNIVWTTGQTVTTPDSFGPPVIVANVDSSPADFVIQNDKRRPIRFELEMRLGSGWVMVSESRPTCTAMLNPIESYFRLITGAYTMTAKDRVIRGDASGGAFDLTLPPPTSVPLGWHADLRNMGAANNITLKPSGSETIDGAGTLTMTPGFITLVYTNGTNWYR